MRSGGCWSSVVATAEERAVLRLTTENDWLVACVLPEGTRAPTVPTARSSTSVVAAG